MGRITYFRFQAIDTSFLSSAYTAKLLTSTPSRLLFSMRADRIYAFRDDRHLVVKRFSPLYIFLNISLQMLKFLISRENVICFIINALQCPDAVIDRPHFSLPIFITRDILY